jgi:uncharacterized protein (TIGR03435 family)
MRNMTLADLIQWAYTVERYQIEGPSWIGDDRFDVSARPESSASESQHREMLQALLTDRFKLELHRDTKEMSVLLLNIARNGHKLKEATEPGNPSFRSGGLNLTGTGSTIAQLSSFLSREVRMPVVDRTGLTGLYNYFLDIRSFVTDEVKRNMPRDGVPLEAPSIISSAMQEQLGLRLDASKAPTPLLIIDRAERQPTEN